MKKVFIFAIAALSLASCSKSYDPQRTTKGLIDIKCDSCKVQIVYRSSIDTVDVAGNARVTILYQQSQTMAITNIAGTPAVVIVADNGAVVQRKELTEGQRFAFELF